MDAIGQLVYDRHNKLIGWIYHSMGGISQWVLAEYQNGHQKSLTAKEYSEQLADYKSLVSQVKKC